MKEIQKLVTDIASDYFCRVSFELMKEDVRRCTILMGVYAKNVYDTDKNTKYVLEDYYDFTQRVYLRFLYLHAHHHNADDIIAFEKVLAKMRNSLTKKIARFFELSKKVAPEGDNFLLILELQDKIYYLHQKVKSIIEQREDNIRNKGNIATRLQTVLGDIKKLRDTKNTDTKDTGTIRNAQRIYDSIQNLSCSDAMELYNCDDLYMLLTRQDEIIAAFVENKYIEVNRPRLYILTAKIQSLHSNKDYIPLDHINNMLTDAINKKARVPEYDLS